MLVFTRCRKSSVLKQTSKEKKREGEKSAQSMNGMYTGTSHQCMFQPQDQIEVGEDGFKQYDGKPGFL